jgi:uncharacterized membrane protein YkvA (DUF1232 family)
VDAWLWALVGLLAALLLLAIAAWWLLRRLPAQTRALARRIARLPWRAKGTLALALLRDRRLPLRVRLVIPAVVLYLALPLDIIPDFIPVLGQLDDVFIVLVAVALLLRSLPEGLLEEQILRIERDTSRALAP